MDREERHRVESLRRAIASTEGDGLACVDCWHAGALRLCARHRAIGLRNIERIRAEHGWRRPDAEPPTLSLVE